ncbi:MocR-like pyridoxine biosynthesis transcription factor PdxR [Paenibacillus soyae]|uniref:PLP-dependent aminotransferase family protein n=1 Tax=Paenibacillus soyae TaxID=2969249 RepID=A0A9X2S6Y2_9BACL|nr:PLP-dependent aminotransferase family protein [Paenibacillus soyae]MCR2802729.1 PLP-dependent aminotransferase family protein [Paenibacillus soyae]
MYGISIDRRAELSVTRQICDLLRQMIESGRLPAGTRLLPTRVLAKEWGIARNGIIEVYEQLTAEGYLEGRVGAGTYVAEGITPVPRKSEAPAPAPSKAALSDGVRTRDLIDFASGVPDDESFPRSAWAKELRYAAESISEDSLGYGSIQGSMELREVIRDYVFRTKGIICEADQIIIVSGASEAIMLIAHSLASEFRSVYLEDPTIGFTQDIFRALNYTVIPVEVDQHGMAVDTLSRLEACHLMLLTPSHQFPTGSLLSIQRRQQAIRMAAESEAYLIEDDYDSEFRLKGVPVPPLQTLAPDRVLHVGTFSKTLTPSIRIGYAIVPPHLTERLLETKEMLNLYTPFVIQKALSRFIRGGHLDRHIHAMKKEYRKRRALLKEQLRQAFGENAALLGDEAGMHLQVCFQPASLYSGIDWEKSVLFGVRVDPADDYRLRKPGKSEPRIVLGYGNLYEERIVEGVRRLASFVRAQIRLP